MAVIQSKRHVACDWWAAVNTHIQGDAYGAWGCKTTQLEQACRTQAQTKAEQDSAKPEGMEGFPSELLWSNCIAAAVVCHAHTSWPVVAAGLRKWRSSMKLRSGR